MWLLVLTTAFLMSNIGGAQLLTISGQSPVRLSWPTNLVHYGIVTTTNLNSYLSWQVWSVTPSISGTNYLVTNSFNDSSRYFQLYSQRASCANRLRFISISLRMWSDDNNGKYPFQLPFNLGGTREFRAIGPDGFDTNAFRHFQVLSNLLVSPRYLVCPSDQTRSAATNFAVLEPENVTYQLRTSDDVCPDAPGVVLAVCPIDGNTLYCDGTAVEGSN